MSALLMNLAGLGSGAGPRAAGPAQAILGTDGSASGVRFGETLREQTSEGGGLLGKSAADADLQIDDADILKQFIETSTHTSVVARTRVTVGAEDASSEDSSEGGDGDEAAVSWVPLASSALELASASVTAGPSSLSAAASVASDAASARDVKANSLASTTPSAPRGVANANPVTSFVDDVNEVSVANASTPQSSLATRMSIAMNAARPSDQQPSNLLASQSQPLLMALASGTGDATAQKIVATDQAAEAPAAAPNRQALVDALGERLSVQLNRGSSQATLRLDPPMMGTIEIVIRHDAAGVQVHLSASHGDVLRQLHSIGNALSQDLVQRNHGEVTVHVSESSRDGEGRQRNRQGDSADGESTPGHALRTADEPERAVAFTLA